MIRIGFATIVGVLGLLAYIAASVSLFDQLSPLNAIAQLLYFAIAGSLWVIPMRSLMYWGAGRGFSGRRMRAVAVG